MGIGINERSGYLGATLAEIAMPPATPASHRFGCDNKAFSRERRAMATDKYASL